MVDSICRTLWHWFHTYGQKAEKADLFNSVQVIGNGGKRLSVDLVNIWRTYVHKLDIKYGNLPNNVRVTFFFIHTFFHKIVNSAKLWNHTNDYGNYIVTKKSKLLLYFIVFFEEFAEMFSQNVISFISYFFINELDRQCPGQDKPALALS